MAECQTKKSQMASFVSKRKRCEAEALAVVHQFIETGVTKELLLEKAGKISARHMDDIAAERNLTGICGWPLCEAKLGPISKQKYIIRNKKVIDITERKNFCSSSCYTTWIHFKANLMTSPLWLRDEEPTPTFTIFEPDESKGELLHGILVKLQNVSLDDVKPEKESDDEDDE